MKKSPGFSLVEILVVITIIGILMAILLPAAAGALDRAKLQGACANASGIVKLCNLIQVDEVGSGDPTAYSWPGTNAANRLSWYGCLPSYSSTNDLIKLFTAGSVIVSSYSTNAGSAGPNTNAFLIYQVTTDSPSDTILMTTANWTATTNGVQQALTANGRPFGVKGAVVVKKGGSAQVLTPRQVTNDIGTIGTCSGVIP